MINILVTYYKKYIQIYFMKLIIKYTMPNNKSNIIKFVLNLDNKYQKSLLEKIFLIFKNKNKNKKLMIK